MMYFTHSASWTEAPRLGAKSAVKLTSRSSTPLGNATDEPLKLLIVARAVDATRNVGDTRNVDGRQHVGINDSQRPTLVQKDVDLPHS